MILYSFVITHGGLLMCENFPHIKCIRENFGSKIDFHDTSLYFLLQASLFISNKIFSFHSESNLKGTVKSYLSLLDGKVHFSLQVYTAAPQSKKLLYKE